MRIPPFRDLMLDRPRFDGNRTTPGGDILADSGVYEVIVDWRCDGLAVRPRARS
jgi:hypothetical protein